MDNWDLPHVVLAVYYLLVYGIIGFVVVGIIALWIWEKMQKR